MRAGSFLLFACICAVPYSTGQAQQRAGGPSLGRPTAQSADGFTNVGSIRELSNGRVLVADPGEKTVQLLDLTAGTAVRVGREGQGPGEYSFPGALLPLAGDSTLLVDPSNRRFLIILPNGKAGGHIPFPENLGIGADPQYSDLAGRIYFRGSLIPPGGPGSMASPPDSVPVLRWDRRRATVDTVTFLKITAMTMRTSSSGQGRMMMMRPEPFSPEDTWAVGADGRMAVARVTDFHVDWYSPAKQRTSGPVNRHQPVRVNDADRESQQRAQGAPRVTFGSGPGASGPPPTVNMPAPQYPGFKPPFPGRNSAWVAPNGQLWLLRSRRGGDPVPTVDVFDQQGTFVRTVTLPRDRRIAGFGKNSVYLVRTDGDDIQWLESYTI